MNDTPLAPPTETESGFSSPICIFLDYKQGKIDSPAVAAKTDASDVEAGFHYWVKDEGKKRPQSLTLYAIGKYSRFGGRIFNANNPKDSESFTSTLYRIPSDTIYFRQEYVKKVRQHKHLWTVGNYSQVRKFADAQHYGKSVGYRPTMIFYAPELGGIVEIRTGKVLEVAMARAIAELFPGSKPNTKQLSGLCELSGQFWYFRWTGEFEKVSDVDGMPYKGVGKMAFAPVLKAGVVRSDSDSEKTREHHAKLSDYYSDVSAYVDRDIEYAKRVLGGDFENAENQPNEQHENYSEADPFSTVPAPAGDAGFPETEHGRNYEDNTPDGEILPF